MKKRKAKIVVKPIIVEPVVITKVDVHQIFNKLKQLHDNYKSKFFIMNNSYSKFSICD